VGDERRRRREIIKSSEGGERGREMGGGAGGRVDKSTENGNRPFSASSRLFPPLFLRRNDGSPLFHLLMDDGDGDDEEDGRVGERWRAESFSCEAPGGGDK
jgi:hypothetical protein